MVALPAPEDMPELLASVRGELRRAWPYALALALLLGAVVVVGANLSNAFPSQERPFGWPGPANLENGVAMVRTEIILACTLPALLLGATALRARDPREDSPADLLPALGVDVALLVVAAFAAALIAWIGAAKSPFPAVVAFGTAEALLALAFFSLGWLAAALFGSHGVAAAGAIWLFFTAVYENWTRVILFRQVGYGPLASGQFPSWFWASQALSPLTAYRGVLILWRRGFMDYLEKAALGSAALPAWMTPATFASVMIAMWVVLPLGLALGAWWLKGRRRPAPAGDTAKSGSHLAEPR